MAQSSKFFIYAVECRRENFCKLFRHEGIICKNNKDTTGAIIFRYFNLYIKLFRS